MKKILLSSLLLTLGYFSSNAQCPSGRYLVKTFAVDTIKDILYGSNTATSGTGTTNLLMDIYQPAGDILPERPLIIFAHGGTFVAGDRKTTDMIKICAGLAQRGYVCASIEYRLESATALISPTANEKMVKEVVRAAQDGKAAVRFFRADAAGSNIYKIDTNQIFFGGTSAGGILALHLAYMQATDPLPASWITWANAIGGFEGNSGSPGHSSNVKAVVSYAGAIGDVAWMNETTIPWVDFHSVNDGTVPDSIGYPLGLTNLPLLSGGRVMNQHANTLGYYHEYWPFAGSNHPPFADGSPVTWDTIESKTAQFLYKNLACNPDHINVKINDIILGNNAAIAIYPIPFNNLLNIESLDMKQIQSIAIYDGLGKEILTLNGNNQNAINMDMSKINKGIYFLKLNIDGVTYTSKIIKE